MKLSIIIPMLNEEASLSRSLGHWQSLIALGCELIVVDGGSLDASHALVEAAGLRVLRSQRGRAAQMNAGAAHATGSMLLFLHADTRLPLESLREDRDRMAAEGRVWGRFNVQIDSLSPALAMVSFFINLRSALTGIATGDQALFMSPSLFEAVGGFPELPLMEDIAISSRLRRIQRPLCLRSRVLTSARRWEKYGTWRTILLMWRLRWAYWRGTSAHDIAKEYGP